MDAFFAAVEVLDAPELAGKALVVGGTGRRGVVASCSYEARAYGVRSAMPVAEARRLCPHAIFVPGRYHRYSECSHGIHEIFARYTPLVEGIALDEAFLDVRFAMRLFGPPPEIAARVRREVAAEVGLSCSVGVAATKFVAKLASEAAKPRASLQGTVPGRGIVVVEPGEELGFLHPMPVEALWGVGPATAQRLRRLGLTTVGQLAAVPQSVLESAVGRAHGRHLHQLAWGIDPRPVTPNQAPKSIGHEETWAYDRYDGDDLHRQLVRMADAVATRLRQAGFAGRTVTLKVRFGDFTTITRSQTVPYPLDTGADLVSVAGGLLSRVDPSPGVRLMGLSVSSLGAPAAGGATQLALELDGERPPVTSAGRTRGSPAGLAPIGSAEAAAAAPGTAGPPASPAGDVARRRAWQAAAGALDAVRRRFGDGAVGPATLLGEDGLRVKRRGDTQWGPPA